MIILPGTWQWGEAAFAHFQKLCMGKVINATVVGFNVNDKVPMVELTVLDEENKVSAWFWFAFLDRNVL